MLPVHPTKSEDYKPVFVVKVMVILTFELKVNRGHLKATTNPAAISLDCRPKCFIIN
jgi:hypothetical protein